MSQQSNANPAFVHPYGPEPVIDIADPQPEEKENNVGEYMYCEDCGEELPLPDNPEIN